MAFLPVLLLTGCGVDKAASNGELGKLQFSLVSDYYVEEQSLADSRIVTGDEQNFDVELTAEGAGDAGKAADEISFRAEGEGVQIVQPGADGDAGADDPDAESVRDFSLSASAAGEVIVEALLEGEVFNRITLNFAAPDALELAMFAREPYAEAFESIETDATVAVSPGTQLAWLGIPTEGGDRLLGNVRADMSADPASAVVPAANVEHVNEAEAQSIFRADSLYFIETGAVTVTIENPANAVSGAADFDVGA